MWNFTTPREGDFEEQHLFIYLLIYLLNRPIEKLFIPLRAQEYNTMKNIGKCPALPHGPI